MILAINSTPLQSLKKLFDLELKEMKVDWKKWVNLMVNSCIVLIFMSVSVEIDFETLNCESLCVNMELLFM